MELKFFGTETAIDDELTANGKRPYQFTGDRAALTPSLNPVISPASTAALNGIQSTQPLPTIPLPRRCLQCGSLPVVAF